MNIVTRASLLHQCKRLEKILDEKEPMIKERIEELEAFLNKERTEFESVIDELEYKMMRLKYKTYLKDCYAIKATTSLLITLAWDIDKLSCISFSKLRKRGELIKYFVDGLVDTGLLTEDEAKDILI